MYAKKVVKEIQEGRCDRGIPVSYTHLKRQAVCLNAGAALYIAGKAETIAKGVRRAEQLLDSGAALAKLEEFIRESNAEEQR